MTNHTPPTLAERVDHVNRVIRETYAKLGWNHPVGCVQWVHIDRIKPNEYNPNAVAFREMKLLFTSIESDGYTQPVVTIANDPDHPDTTSYSIVDGFHRYTIMRKYRSVYATTGGYLPIVVIDKPIADRIASTVRHNRARGKHSMTGMSSLVFQMLAAGNTDEEICNKLGMEAEELMRLKHITGYSKLYSDVPYTRLKTTMSMMDIKKKYKERNPDDPVPEW